MLQLSVYVMFRSLKDWLYKPNSWCNSSAISRQVETAWDEMLAGAWIFNGNP